MIEGVFGEFLGEGDENGFALLDPAVAELSDGEHEAGKRGEVVAVLGGEGDEADALGLVGAGAGHSEDPTDGSGFQAEHVVLNARGEVCVVEVRVDETRIR